MTVEGSQCHLATAEFQLVERGVNNLPVQFERLGGRHSGNQVEQGSDGAAGGEHSDFVGVVGGLKDALQATLDPLDKPQPAFQPGWVIGAGQPALDEQGEDALELAAVLRAIAQDMHGIGFAAEQLGQQAADNRFAVELVEGAVCLQRRNRQAEGAVLIERGGGGVLLATQVAGDAAIKRETQVCQMATEHLRLFYADGRQDVIVVCTEGGLAMSNQIDAAHVRFPGTLKVWRGYGDACDLSMKKHTLVLKARWSPPAGGLITGSNVSASVCWGIRAWRSAFLRRHMDFLAEYASFLAKTVTLVVAILVVLISFAALRSKGRRKSAGQLQVSKLNDFYKGLRERLESSLLDKDQLKALRKSESKAEKKKGKQKPEAKPRVFVLDFDGDIKASATESLRHEITALLSLATPKDEVVLRLESGGGMVHSYGLASSQLARIRQAGVPLTVCIDKVAASGGYMMACIGEKIISAPFAILGSIGVVAQLPNVNRLLKKHDIDFEVLTAGEYKRTLTVFGENTEKGREKFQEDLDITHQLFKNFVSRYRPQLAIDDVATGEVWLGVAALDKQLVDELQTSDEYLATKAKTAEVFHLHYAERKSLQERVGLAASGSVDRVLLTWWSRLTQQRFW